MKKSEQKKRPPDNTTKKPRTSRKTDPCEKQKKEKEPNKIPETTIVKPKPEKPNPMLAAVNKYKEFGWVVISAPENSSTDLIVQKDRKLHFVQVITPENKESAKFTGLAKNTFIQNAFSNSATPIYCHVVWHHKRDNTLSYTVTFENVNENVRVIVGKKKEINDPK